MKVYLFIAFCLMISAKVIAQHSPASTQPFLFSVNTLTNDASKWNLQFAGSYGRRATGQFGYDGLGQQLGIKGSLGNRFTISGSLALGFANTGKTASAQQLEIIRDIIGGKKSSGFRLGGGLGIGRDWSNVKSASGRIAASFDKMNWRMIGNLRFEKAFDSSRDKLDFITSFGIHRQLAKTWFVGLEAIGQDLEGFWEKDEAEGGAKLMVGPSVNFLPTKSKLSFSLAGGPVFYATRSNVAASAAFRELTPFGTENGYTLRALINFSLGK
ncbi:hypothetical protein EZ428_18230 [Pedobacter frigiditerrae]|uniref:Outer membrane protein beta-barrel domain-containing protein n=1 Tax=Pedobacter frigiditerrae TaxID=2530452 RepID=A0A4R0MP16_9SPHI|nr:hypothetical protein [Pedobacter frigiditerrae]TCC88579.1 hypothetical protein EZ428_18230 [Pedobacter frigiditerrae]